MTTNRARYDAERLRAQLTVDEGLRLKPYRCSEGKLTIGIGRNIEDRGISVKEAHFLLEEDIDACVKDLDNRLPWWRGLNAVRQEVLINMCFNMGIGSRTPARGLLSFRNTLEHMRNARYEQAAAGMLESRWARQVGRRAERLAQMMRTGAPL